MRLNTVAPIDTPICHLFGAMLPPTINNADTLVIEMRMKDRILPQPVGISYSRWATRVLPINKPIQTLVQMADESPRKTNAARVDEKDGLE